VKGCHALNVSANNTVIRSQGVLQFTNDTEDEADDVIFDVRDLIAINSMITDGKSQISQAINSHLGEITSSDMSFNELVGSVDLLYQESYNMGHADAFDNIQIAINAITPTEDCDAVIITYSWVCNIQSGAWTQTYNYFKEGSATIIDTSHSKSGEGKSHTYKVTPYKLKKGVAYTSSISQNPNSWTEGSGSYASGINFIIYSY